MKTDEKLRADVTDAIRWDPLLEPISAHIGVTANDGVITLAGQVDTFIQKHVLEDVAKKVQGVSFVAMDVEVQLAGAHLRSDTDIAQHAKDALSRLAIIDLEMLDVCVEDGWITLEGTVPWNYQRTLAEEYVNNLRGVRGVTNRITLRGDAADAGLVSKGIMAAFHRHATLDAAAIQVAIEGTKVILQGTVRSWTEKKDAEKVAWSAPGIKSVDNRIVVDAREYVN